MILFKKGFTSIFFCRKYRSLRGERKKKCLDVFFFLKKILRLQHLRQEVDDSGGREEST